MVSPCECENFTLQFPKVRIAFMIKVDIKSLLKSIHEV